MGWITAYRYHGLTAAVGSFEGDTVGSDVVGLGVTGL